ncbi:MAG TPA: isoprenylcysteine carboxylmethyltransferase family protein [Casimicrobiaceae bacterium]|nr:isoprenylcysteine carboxylmethyltransferase family protein [Casimicrobiaceae bacterium]
MGAFLSLCYGAVVYLFCLATFAYSIGFVGDIVVPKSIDSGTPGPLVESLLVNVLLLGLFAIQHSVMARKSFKQWWTRIVPHAVERSTYVLAASLALALLLWQWRSIPEPVVWRVENPVASGILHAVFWSGWALLFFATFLINHFELFGLHQVVARAAGQTLPESEFRTPLVYRYVRHPIYLGLVLAFWSTPAMTAGHLLFAVATTGYILIGIWFEERDLVTQFGDKYRRYRAEVGMLVPGRWG